MDTLYHHVCLFMCVVIGLFGWVSSQTSKEIRESYSLQHALDVRFADVDKNGGRSARAMHTAFVGSSPRARALGYNYQERMSNTLRSIKRFRGYSGAMDPAIMMNTLMLGANGMCANRSFICDERHKFRTSDGSCNNIHNPTWGKSFIPFRRFLGPQYDDGMRIPRLRGMGGIPLPSARLVSTTVHTPDDSYPVSRSITSMVMQWGQFLDHDITLSPIRTGMNGMPLTCCPDDVPPFMRTTLDVSLRDGCFPIPIPLGDRHFRSRCMHFARSIQADNSRCSGIPAEQMNQLTAYIDASQVYGSTPEEVASLRMMVGGLLKMSRFTLLPRDRSTLEVCTDQCFKAGDERVNEQMGLTSIQTIFMREHNRIALTLKKINPHWNDERLFQESRRIIGAICQKITYNDFLPRVLNRATLTQYRLNSPSKGYYNVYDKLIDPSIRNAFAAAAFRFGHSLIRSTVSRRRQDFSVNRVVRTRDMFGNTAMVTASNGEAVHELLRGKLIDRPCRVDRFMSREVTDFLFIQANSSLDLAALNIQRGRDHGLPGYISFRRWCGLSSVVNFLSAPGGLVDHDVETTRRLAAVYRHPADIDLFTGGLSERPLRGSLVGPTLSCLLAHQFSALKKGDRFWFELNRPHTRFSPAQLQEIRRSSLSRLLCDNTNTFHVQIDAFKTISGRNPRVSCFSLPRLDLTKWQELHGGLPGHGVWPRCFVGHHLFPIVKVCLPWGHGCWGAVKHWKPCHPVL
ncbi:peroxidasin-like [Haliotis rufescens]|uniref:peroxidasin-like n=1 Tax=Haliotis rufescens TaxID=6454 RepID=UPI00201F5ACA|nr:peroxidasin-like [Haliotis rufescens]XP_048249365.1 peroxidasin-like [Haliotis rufescens]